MNKYLVTGYKKELEGAEPKKFKSFIVEATDFASAEMQANIEKMFTFTIMQITRIA